MCELRTDNVHTELKCSMILKCASFCPIEHKNELLRTVIVLRGEEQREPLAFLMRNVLLKPPQENYVTPIFMKNELIDCTVYVQCTSVRVHYVECNQNSIIKKMVILRFQQNVQMINSRRNFSPTFFHIISKIFKI